MPSITVAFENQTENWSLEDPQTALEQAEEASRRRPGVTDVWLFDAIGTAPWHASVALPPKGNRAKKTP